MIGLKVNGEFLDIKPGIVSEIERKSPFFAMNDYASEVTTDTIAIPYTAKNALALDLPYQYYSERKKQKYENVEYYSDNLFVSKCTLVIETGILNLNNIEATEISGYALFGGSMAFQEFKGKLMKDLVLGGVRSIPWTTIDPYDGSIGYWQHFHDTWINSSIPYVFAPVRNEGYSGDGGPEWMNKIYDNGQLTFDTSLPLVPMIRLKYLLEQIFTELNYQYDFSLLNGTGWDKMILVNLTSVNWTTLGDIGGTIVPVYSSIVHIDLSKHVPQDKTITEFLIALFYRFGWAPLFDTKKKKCTIFPIKFISSGAHKDWTKFVNPRIDSTFNEDPKLFAFKNTIDDGDSYPTSADLGSQSLLPGWPSKFTLDTPSAIYEGKVVFCFNENQYYRCDYDTTTNSYEWVLFSDNIFDYDPANSTNSIETQISTLPIQLSVYLSESGIDYAGFFPAMKQDKNSNIGFRLLFYFGKILDTRLDTLAGLHTYPYASSIRVDHYGTAYNDWSNVYKHTQPVGNNEYGIIEYWWKKALGFLQSSEVNKMNINLPLNELSAFNWSDIILIKNIPYIVQSFIEPFPYRGFIQATLKRINYEPYTEPVIITGVAGGLTIYAKMSFSNATVVTHTWNGTGTSYPPYQMHYHDITLNLYQDAAGTIDYVPTGTLYLLYRYDIYSHGVVKWPYQSYIGMNSNYLLFKTQELFLQDVPSTGAQIFEYRYSLDVNASTDYVII